MDRFSFVMVLLSIIVGLGVTELLSGIARQIQNRSKAAFYWLHSLLVALVFVALVQQWWESWDQKSVEVWTFPVLIMMLGGPIGLYIIAHLLSPDNFEGTDLKTYYYENQRAIFVVALLTVIAASLYRPIGFGDDIIDPDNVPSLLAALVFIVLAISKRRIVHEVLVPILLASVLFDVLFFHLSI